MDELVERLSHGNHFVKFEDRIEEFELIRKRIEDGFIFITFTETRGGTELGLNLDRQTCHFDDADFDTQTGKMHIEGHCTLNFVPVRCIADIDLSTRAGTAKLVPEKK